MGITEIIIEAKYTGRFALPKPVESNLKIPVANVGYDGRYMYADM